MKLKEEQTQKDEKADVDDEKIEVEENLEKTDENIELQEEKTQESKQNESLVQESETKKPNKVVQIYKNFKEKHSRLAEIIRFIFFGGIATVVDWLVMGVCLYIFDPSLYPKFYNVWVGKIGEPETIATIVGTGAGFLVSLVVNYILSVTFVYEDKGSSKTTKGRILFAVLSAIGLLLNVIGMWFGRDVCKINEWLVKFIMTIIVLIYNYITRKIFIFKPKQEKENKIN